MLDKIFNGIFDSPLQDVIAVSDFLLCICVSILLGVIMAFGYMFRTAYTKSFVITLALLPAVVCVVIMMVNGNVGTGVAVAGAFSLVRFRSMPGTAKEICSLFFSMSTGLIAGMGYLGFAALFTLIMTLFLVFYNFIGFGTRKNEQAYKTLNITVPEDLDYTGAFEDVLSEYASAWEIIRVKTVNMGSMFRITYNITMKSTANEKNLIDELRIRNGNLEISLSRQERVGSEL